MTDRNKIAVKTAAFVGALGALSFASTAAAETAASEPTTEELMQQLESLQQKGSDLETRQDVAADELDQQAVDAAVSRVLDDAEKRSELLSLQGFTAGYNRGFVLQSDDGAFRLNPYFMLQFRYVFNVAEGDGEPISGLDDDFERFDDGFEMRRVRFGAKGNAFTEKLEYKFQWTSDRSGGDLVLDDAWIIYEFADNWAFRAGQWKDNVFLEENVSSSRQMGVDRSLVNELIAGGYTDRVQGASLIYADESIRTEVAFHDGANTDNTPYTRGGTGNAEYGVSGRFEYKVSGDSWDPAKDFSNVVNAVDEDFLMIGAGANFSDFANEWALAHTVDALYKTGSMPLSVFGAYYGFLADDGGDTSYNAGAEVQVAYGIGEKQEIFGRAGVFLEDLDNDSEVFDDIDDDILEFTVGYNYYFEGHAAKVTVDATWLPEGSPSTQSGIGVVGNDDENQLIFRGQFQLLL